MLRRADCVDSVDCITWVASVVVRVGLVTEQLLAAVPGGTGRYSREFAAALARTTAPGDSVFGVVARHASTAAAQVHGVAGPVELKLPRRGLILAWQYGVGPRVAGDLVHALTPLAPPRRGSPVVVTVHDAVPWTHPETLTPRGVAWHRAAIGRAARFADAVVVPTRVVADELLAVLPALSEDRLTVLGAGVPDIFRTRATITQVGQARRRFDLPDEYLITVSTLEPRKGLDVLLDAVKLLGDAAPFVVIVGPTGWGGIDVAVEIERRGMDSARVRSLGFVDDVTLVALVTGATALVMPSRAEGFGLPVLEAMAVGTPVVCSALAVLEEVTAGSALLVPPGDARALAEVLRDLSRDEAALTRLSAAGSERATAFDWNVVADRAWALYRRVVQDQHAPS